MKLLITLLTFSITLMSQAEDIWSVGQQKKDDKAIVYKFRNNLPKNHKSMPWLTVISWKYDGSENKGMPPKNINQKMITLEDAFEKIKGESSIYSEVYSRTGLNLKEFVFYISDREAFMKNFNEALKGHETYPIEINFYDDKEWKDLKELHDLFGIASS